MKKIFTICMILILPRFCFPQNAPVVKQFLKNVKEITRVLEYNDNVRILQVNNSNDDFDVVAINENMEELWRTNLKGYALTLANFKGKVLAVAATDYGTFKSNNNTYKGFIINGKTGNVEFEKLIFDGQQEKSMVPAFFSSKDGSNFKIVVRQNNVARRMHMGLPGPLALIAIHSIESDYLATSDLMVLDVDDKLNVTSTLKPAIDEGYFADVASGRTGDAVIAWMSGGSIKLVKYNQNAKSAQGEITEDLEVSNIDDKRDCQNLKLIASKTPDVYYTAIVIKNTRKEWALAVTKFNFKDKSKKTTYVEYNKQNVKALEKAYKQTDKKIDKPGFGPEKDFDIRNITEIDDKLLVSLSARYVQTGTYSSALIERSMLINAFDTNLDLQFQQQLPSSSLNLILYINSGFHVAKDGLHVAAVYDKTKAIVGTLNVTTGEWDKMEVLDRKKIDANYPDTSNTIWFADSFIMPYADLKGITKTNRDITLQLNQN